MHLKISSAKWRPFCPGGDELSITAGMYSVGGLISTKPGAPFYKHKSTLILAWISYHTPSKVWDEITYPFPTFNGCAVEVWERTSNFIPQFIMDVITYPCSEGFHEICCNVSTAVCSCLIGWLHDRPTPDRPHQAGLQSMANVFRGHQLSPLGELIIGPCDFYHWRGQADL